MTGLVFAMCVRTLAVVGLAIVVGTLLRSARPSARSIVWNSALFACLFTPFVWTVVPSVTVVVPARLLPAATFASVTSAAEGQDQSALGASRGTSSVRPAVPRAQQIDPDTIARFLLYIWLAGAVFVGIRFGRQLLCARRLARQARPVTHAGLAGVLADARSSIGIRRTLAVLESSEIDIPLATGILHPTILLPASVDEWNEEELRIVLLHELAHIRRADILARAVAMTACAIHWFNPLVWMIGAFAVRDAELAADDLVVHTGVRPSTYAHALLNLAGSMFQFPGAQPAMPFARRAALADRIHAILRESAGRSEIGRFASAGVIAASCAVALLAACLRFAPAGAATVVTAPLGPVSRTIVTDSGWIDNATDGLIRALADASPQVRGGAAHSLANLGAKRATPALRSLLEDPDKYVRYEVNEALATLDRTK